MQVEISDLLPSGSKAEKFIVKISASGNIGTPSIGGGISVTNNNDNWLDLNGKQSVSGSSGTIEFDVKSVQDYIQEDGVFQIGYWWGEQNKLTVDSITCVYSSTQSAVTSVTTMPVTTSVSTQEKPDTTVPSVSPTIYGDVNVDEITVRTISDGDTLAFALQAGEINAAYGMAYASYPIFENEDFTFSSTATSRAFYAWMNFESPVTSDPAVRKAIAMGIDKENFVSVLLKGYGYPAVGAFPDTFSFGGQNLTTESYDPDGAKQVLEDAGWVDTDGDGIREKDGQKLVIRWLTYPSRQELPLLAESAQATLKEIGMDVQVNCTSDNNTIRKDPTLWDVYASAMVTAPTGDPQYFFTSCALDSSVSIMDITTAISWKSLQLRWKMNLMWTSGLNWESRCSRRFWTIMPMYSVLI